MRKCFKCDSIKPLIAFKSISSKVTINGKTRHLCTTCLGLNPKQNFNEYYRGFTGSHNPKQREEKIKEAKMFIKKMGVAILIVVFSLIGFDGFRSIRLPGTYTVEAQAATYSSWQTGNMTMVTNTETGQTDTYYGY